MKTNKENNSNVESIRFIQEISGIRTTILVIDKSISLVTELEDDIEESFEKATGFSTYSTDVSRIFPYICIFENLWTQAGLYQQVKKVIEKLIMQDKKYKDRISASLIFRIKRMMFITTIIRIYIFIFIIELVSSVSL
jgi:hypothetical protein